MHDRIGACSFIAAGKSIEEGAAAAASLNVRHVDIGAGGGNAHWDLAELLRDPDAAARDTVAALQRHRLIPNECFALNFGADINSPDPADRRRTIEQFPRLAEFAAQTSCRSVMLIVGGEQPSLGPAGSIARAADVLNELCDIAGSHSLFLNIEPDSESCVRRPDAVIELCEQTPALGLTLDYSHFICQGIAQADIEPLHRFTRHMHIRQAAPQRIVAEAEGGTIDLTRLIACLDRDGYDGLFMVEYLDLPLTRHLDVLEQSRQMIAQLDALLRRGGTLPS